MFATASANSSLAAWRATTSVAMCGVSGTSWLGRLRWPLKNHSISLNSGRARYSRVEVVTTAAAAWCHTNASHIDHKRHTASSHAAHKRHAAARKRHTPDVVTASEIVTLT